MRRILRQWARLLPCVCLLAAGSVSVAAAQGPWPLSREMLDHAELELVWQDKLAVEEGEQLDAMMVLEDRLYVRSNRNYVWSINRATGKMVFHRSIAPAGFPILGWVPYDDSLITVVSNQLIEFDKNTGSQGRVADLELSIVAPVARNEAFYYISATDGRLHAFRANDLVRIFQVTAGGSAMITSVIADDERVVFGTDTGSVIGMATDGPQRLWRFDAGGPIAGPVVTDGRSFFLASKDTQVYRVDVTGPTEATMMWRYQTEAILDREPRVTDTAVYQYAVGRGLTAIGKQSGRALWSLPEGVDLLAEAGNRAYVTTKLKTLAVMDNAAGKQLYSLNFAPVTKYATNTLDANIYVADEQGHVACLSRRAGRAATGALE